MYNMHLLEVEAENATDDYQTSWAEQLIHTLCILVHSIKSMVPVQHKLSFHKKKYKNFSQDNA